MWSLFALCHLCFVCMPKLILHEVHDDSISCLNVKCLFPVLPYYNIYQVQWLQKKEAYCKGSGCKFRVLTNGLISSNRNIRPVPNQTNTGHYEYQAFEWYEETLQNMDAPMQYYWYCLLYMYTNFLAMDFNKD